MAKTTTCKTCGAAITNIRTPRGFRWAHPNGQLFCAEKSYTPDWKRAGYHCPSEYRAMSPDYAAEVRGQNDPSPD
jgi:hypothetical protein